MAAGSSSQRSAKGAGGALSYHTSSYWNSRFATDPREASGFEWLSSSSSLLSCIPSCILTSPSPRILHIGVGTSSLSLDIARYFHAQDGDCSRAAGVMNVDFAPRSIEFQRSAERQWLQSIAHSVDEVMPYKVLDLLDWSQVCEMQGGFDVVLDKSTADSISTGQDLHLDDLPTIAHPALRKIAQHTKAIPTIQVLGIHLAALVKKGGVWLCHSYSSDRWADVVVPPDAQQVWPWRLGEVVDIPVESDIPNAPQIQHHIYTLHRI